MSTHSILIFIHILFAGIFTGAFLILTVQHRASMASELSARKVQTAMMLTTAQRAARIGSTLILLFGVLLIWSRPAVMSGGQSMHMKLLIGILAIGLSHMASAKIGKLAVGLAAGDDISPIDGKLSWMLPLTLVLIIVTIFLGVTRYHM